MMHQRPTLIVAVNESDWLEKATTAIRDAVNGFIEKQGSCSLMLAGGETLLPLYRQWAVQNPWNHERVNYFFGDERAVPPDHPDSNFGMVMRSLFPRGLPKDCHIARMQGEDTDRDEAAARYERELPESVDVVLLGMGADGHIASLFPGCPRWPLSQDRRVISVYGPKPPPNRLTITPAVVKNAKSVFLLARGANKGVALKKAINDPTDTVTMPVRLTLHATWILDAEASNPLTGRETT